MVLGLSGRQFDVVINGNRSTPIDRDLFRTSGKYKRIRPVNLFTPVPWADMSLNPFGGEGIVCTLAPEAEARVLHSVCLFVCRYVLAHNAKTVFKVNFYTGKGSVVARSSFEIGQCRVNIDIKR